MDNKEFKGILLAAGSLGLVVCLFVLIASALSLFKTSKLILLACTLISLILFHEGLASNVQARIKRLARFHLREIWQSLQAWRANWCAIKA
ncbi:hypothetical protein [Planctobacterium marinum]|uniref:hypothetical protein n=1 Tax=Planctobacterium marinum TaxID=1631968 RepID=UPI001E61160A|nr:hypothetical protein [Planctobacterium marinum]MCC2604508.1 hypothetical protein [Planctobacterium marinum]